MITHAYLLTREQGNVLFYNTSNAQDLQQIEHLGGVAHQCLSHRDEVGDSLVQIKQRFGVRLYCHQLEEDIVSAVCPVDRVFTGREEFLDGIEVIHTPGHTSGSVCFLVQSSPGRSYLFTGDTILVANDGRWKNGFLPGISDKAALTASLRQLRHESPDVVISSATYGRWPFKAVQADEWRSGVDQALEELG